jgi:hypothetical protein
MFNLSSAFSEKIAQRVNWKNNVFSSPSQHGRFKNEFHSFLSTDAEVMFIM